MDYQRSDSVYIRLQHKTYTFSTDTWALADPDATYPKISIVDSAGVTKVNAQTMTKEATGKYEYLYQLASDAALGEWTGYILVANSTYTDKQDFTFNVEA